MKWGALPTAALPATFYYYSVPLLALSNRVCISPAARDMQEAFPSWVARGRGDGPSPRSTQDGTRAVSNRPADRTVNCSHVRVGDCGGESEKAKEKKESRLSLKWTRRVRRQTPPLAHLWFLDTQSIPNLRFLSGSGERYGFLLLEAKLWGASRGGKSFYQILNKRYKTHLSRI